MDEPVTIKPGLARRLDLLALANERASPRTAWIFGAIAVWALIGAVSAAIAGDWGILLVVLGAALVSGLGWGLTVRANRLVPETKRWLAELSGTPESS